MPWVGAWRIPSMCGVSASERGMDVRGVVCLVLRP